MPGQRSQFAAVGSLIQREKNDRKIRLIAELIEQRAKSAHVIRRRRDVGANVAAVSLIELAIVIARAARVNLHDQAVFEAHARHFCQHLGTKEFMLLSVAVADNYAAKEFRSLCRGKIRGSRGRMPVIGFGAAQSAEMD